MKAKRKVVTAVDRTATQRPGGRRPSSDPAARSSPRPQRPGGRPRVARSRQPTSGEERTDRDIDLTVDLAPGHGGLVLANPILVASGTFGYGIEYGDVVDVERLGAICCKGTTLKPRVGNITPRVTETPGGMLNSIGLQNPGVDAVIEKYAPLWQGWQMPVIVNVAGESIADYVEVVRRLDGVPGVAGIELNISCPNVGKGGLQFAIERAGRRCRHRRGPAGDRPAAPRQALAERRRRPSHRPGHRGGRRRRHHRDQHAVRAGRRRGTGRRPLLGNVFGGVSGPAVKPIALGSSTRSCQVVDIPVVAIGGVTDLDDVLDFLAVGAVAVQVGTAIFADPGLPVRLVGELAAAARRAGHDSYRPFIGTALPRKPGTPSAKGVEYRP